MLAPLLLWSLLWFSGSALSSTCDCTGTLNGGSASSSYVCRDARLGPAVLPHMLPLGTFVSNYDRLGGLTPGDFLKKWTDDRGNYVYPPQNGFQLDKDGRAINGTMILQPGTLVDRFGSEHVSQSRERLMLTCVVAGGFVSAANAPYSQRALPPSNLDTNPSAPDFPYNYHVYRVLKPLTVVGGPVAPWFGQPGLGAQFYTGGVGNIMALIAGGYLQRESTTALIAGGKKACA
ncbi:hypothetical protein TPAR_03110 [Tolypocladium paradoxum]|uniref:TNT domain-containing protein n=1 Tax=Tolypocladium paradoxum TaxID=94208 RepID=A0A2S4L2P6_9HYPO|nr:hypothetical protein TPAR_03110 [Tolypocladium paradoxum]